MSKADRIDRGGVGEALVIIEAWESLEWCGSRWSPHPTWALTASVGIARGRLPHAFSFAPDYHFQLFLMLN
ncbi:hypothetical protein ACFL2Q_19580 [Thermodesulfobacteriota bacterium]